MALKSTTAEWRAEWRDDMTEAIEVTTFLLRDNHTAYASQSFF
jgi:hypothetical protein